MNRIDKKFRTLKLQDRKAFIAYITAGDPNLTATANIVLALERSGTDIIELGIPFSDPLADGPTIQAASQRALKGKTTLNKIFNMVGSLRKETDIPIIFMTYFNPVLRYGIRKFFKYCRIKGVDGVIIPDLPIEEATEVTSLGKGSGVDTIFLVAPTSTKDRIARIAHNSRGFIYYVSLTGVTGARAKLPAELLSKVKYVKSITTKPVAVGFGVSDPKQAAQIAKVADGVIVGSAIVKIIGAKKDVISRVSKFSKRLADAIHNI